MNIFNEQEENVIKTSVLKVRDNTLVFSNSIYQISNISEVKTMNLSTEKSMPQFIWVFLLIGAVLMFVPDTLARLIGLLFLGVFGFLVWRHLKTKVNEKYGLFMSLNSGRNQVIVSNNLEFVNRVAMTLHNIMNTKNASVNFDFSSNTINDLGAGDGSVVVMGDVAGDIANNIE